MYVEMYKNNINKVKIHRFDWKLYIKNKQKEENTFTDF